jgi:peptidoglycan hydrolase CwlO-like protein
MYRYIYKIKFAFIILAVFIAPGVVSAELTDEQREAERARLKNEIVQKEMEIQAERIKLLNTKTVREGYEGEAERLRSKIRQANLIIQKQKLAIKALDYKIQDKESTIDELDQKVKREKESLAQLIRKTNEYDNISLVELILGGEGLSEMFTDVDRFSFIKEALNESFIEISEMQNNLRSEQENLAEAKSDKEELKMLQEKQRQEIALTKKEKERLAQLAKQKEKGFEEVIKEKERTVAQIRAQLFALRDSNTGDLSFGTMLGYAKEASARTDVSPALILAILTVETNLGKDLGVGKWYEDMHPTRDVPVFKEIVAELGLNPDEMPISARPCSAAKRKAAGPGNRCGYGYGGAMGPAQFIPSTWILYKDRIARMSGQNPPNPWDPRTAVFATALLMMDNGADKGTRTAEHLAAVRYLAGWRNARKSEYWWYGDRTMRYRDQYAKNIEALGE